MRVKVWFFVFLVWFLTQNVEAAGTIGLPFHEGEKWTACRGYNIQKTEHEKFVFGLAMSESGDVRKRYVRELFSDMSED